MKIVNRLFPLALVLLLAGLFGFMEYLIVDQDKVIKEQGESIRVLQSRLASAVGERDTLKKRQRFLTRLPFGLILEEIIDSPVTSD